MVVLGFYVSPTAKAIRRRDLGFKVSSERLEKPGIELTTPGLKGKWLNHFATEASILTGNDDIHKSLGEFEIRPYPTTDHRVSCP